MDTVTQAVLGAACGQLTGSARLGRRALLGGMVGGLLPDLDALVGPGTLLEFRYHRSFMHSLWFGPVVGTLLGLWLHRRDRAAGWASSRVAWIAVMVSSILTHPLLDWFTTYGTQLLAPFSDRRFALDAVPIVDPVYTVVLLVALRMGARPIPSPRAPRAAGIALVLSTAYLFLGWGLNARAEAVVAAQLAGEGFHGELRVHPTILQPWVRRVVAWNDREAKVGFLRVPFPRPVEWQTFAPASGPDVDAVRATDTGRLFEWFAMGETAASRTGTRVEIDDLRYGFAGEPRRGLWGIGADVDPLGHVGPVERVNRPSPRQGGLAGQTAFLWRLLAGPLN